MATPIPASPTPLVEPVLMRNSRKFKALVLAIVVYVVPMLMTFVLVLTKHAKFEDLKEMVKWCGLSLSPAFLGYIGGTALEGMNRTQAPVAVSAVVAPPSTEE